MVRLVILCRQISIYVDFLIQYLFLQSIFLEFIFDLVYWKDKAWVVLLVKWWVRQLICIRIHLLMSVDKVYVSFFKFIQWQIECSVGLFFPFIHLIFLFGYILMTFFKPLSYSTFNLVESSFLSNWFFKDSWSLDFTILKLDFSEINFSMSGISIWIFLFERSWVFFGDKIDFFLVNFPVKDLFADLIIA